MFFTNHASVFTNHASVPSAPEKLENRAVIVTVGRGTAIRAIRQEMHPFCAPFRNRPPSKHSDARSGRLHCNL
jgi:hypothetical protein